MSEDRMLNDEILLGLIKANAGGGGGGTTNYNLLENKPQIAGTELQGNKSLADLGIASAQSVENITNGENIDNFAGVENALEGKQDALTAGDYVVIENDKISVSKLKQGKLDLYSYEFVSTDISHTPKVKVVKKVNGETISETIYDEFQAANWMTFDNIIRFRYDAGDSYKWKYQCLVTSNEHVKDTVISWYWNQTVNYTETFDVGSSAITDLVTKGDMTDALATKQDALTFDDTPTDGSNNPVKSNGIYDSEKDIYAAMGVMGAKNLISYPYYETTKTKNGVTFTDNGDGTISVTGRAEGGDATFILHTRNQGEINDFTIPNGDYILSGCPSGGTSSSFYLNIGCTKNDAWYTLGEDFGNGKKITCNGDDHSQISVNPAINIIIKSGYSITGTLTFKPMLRLASDTDGTYQPYAKTNKQLTDDVALLDSGKADTDMVAADFNAGTSYTAVNYCVQDGKLYKFKNNHSGAWSSADVDEVKITGELSALKSGLTNKVAQFNVGEITAQSLSEFVLGVINAIHNDIGTREFADVFAIFPNVGYFILIVLKLDTNNYMYQANGHNAMYYGTANISTSTTTSYLITATLT